MKAFETQYKNVLKRAVLGEHRVTRTGETYGYFGDHLTIDLEQGFPVLTGKKIAWKSVVGELLWFLSGKTDIKSLQDYSDLSEDSWTIWTNDMVRWHKKEREVPYGSCGDLYGLQWRDFNNDCVDQITNLINSIKDQPFERNHIVMSYNPVAVQYDNQALKACHTMFQVYVTNDNKLDLQWQQRSVDTFLGLPFNFASYALLLHLLAKWTGYGVGKLSVSLGDVHVYVNQMNEVRKYLSNNTYKLPKLVLPKDTDTLENTLKLTAKDFENSLMNYKHSGTIKAQLSVGE